MTMPVDLLLELGTEDLPARYMQPLAQALQTGLVEGLRRRGVTQGASRTLATPRRIGLLIEAVAERQPDQTLERSGPALAAAFKDGQPTPAALGFAKSCGVAFAEIGQKDGKLHFAKTSPGQPTAALIAEIFEETLKQMDELVPKRMRWGSSEETFVRPVQWLCCLLGSEVVPLQRFGLASGRLTYGHRFHAPDAISLRSPAEYVEALKEAYVWADVASRKAEIRKQIEAEAAKLKGHARITEDLLDEVTALVEWPVAITGHFEQRFLELPPEVIVATVETNQRYFTVFADAAMTQLTNTFITVANIVSRDVAQVIAGNERVVRPRLTDALFFYQQDLKQPLAAYGEKLASITFQKDLGSTAAKVARIGALAAQIAAELKTDAASATRAAQLCKNDLVTKMVYEFPELQGLMGGYYAAKSGEPAAVAQAIREHYLPTQQGTPIPSAREGQLVALADKLDSLAGIFAIGQKPTASKDPYALRRAALGVLRICIEAQLPLDLRTLLKAALDAQPAGKKDDKTLQELLDFVLERLRAYLVGSSVDGREIAVESFEAVRAMNIGEPLDLQRRVLAVHHFAANAAAPNLAAANKRVRNILKQAGAVSETIDAARFEHAAEKALHAKLGEVEARNAQVSDYTQQLVNLASLRESVDAFFEGVMVNAEDAAVRANRLALLKRLDAACRSVADLSLLPG
ncbi:glycyl-tRNA synthetase beta chain [Solimonas aquatica]|uniref:Glycine--tRNA ligase beta subunit n=1 Tax=Solimonas aquatica TaxID=489703 RepID=A0A1H9ETY4_9GAMM|nr:glycine--tRNA ligase subunit beta [Solimonas aquatica]SEQ29082.1 glycyl-tRNA synthetase beta chain [Solimonas aquatica]